LNRGNARATVFHKEGDYAAFVQLLQEADERVPIRLLAYCLMPNHFHLVLWPRRAGPVQRSRLWPEFVNRPQTEAEVQRLRAGSSVRRRTVDA